MGNLIGEDHVNYILMYNMLTGIHIGVSFFVSPPYQYTLNPLRFLDVKLK
jgi:hypothetical protein